MPQHAKRWLIAKVYNNGLEPTTYCKYLSKYSEQLEKDFKQAITNTFPKTEISFDALYAAPKYPVINFDN